MEREISNKIIDTKLLEIGAMYILQYGQSLSYIGKLVNIDKRYSVHWIETITTNKKRKQTVEEKRVLGDPQYDLLIFNSEEQKIANNASCIYRMFNNTTNLNKQFYCTNALIFEQNLIKEEVHDWAVSKMLDVHGSKISNANLAVVVKIAISMMKKKGYFDSSITLVIDKIKDKAIEIIDIKQYEWEQVLESQADQLPF